jgi:tetratricopeptide (TPR) repeat protein
MLRRSVVNALSPRADSAENAGRRTMTQRQREASIPVMVLGGFAVYAAVAIGLYVGISPKEIPTTAPPQPGTIIDDGGGSASGDSAKSEPVSPQEWLAAAAQKRRSHDYQGARDAYSQLIRLNAMTADTWADYADTIASLPGGSLGGEAAVAIRQALSLNPDHPKALWLEATHAYQEHRYTEAVALWKRLRAVLGPESPDAGIIDANIAESEQLARTPAG